MRVADVATRAAVSAPTEGRAPKVPEEPVARLWHAATLLPEHRGDGHNAALLAHGIGGTEAHVLLALSPGMRDRASSSAYSITCPSHSWPLSSTAARARPGGPYELTLEATRRPALQQTLDAMKGSAVALARTMVAGIQPENLS